MTVRKGMQRLLDSNHEKQVLSFGFAEIHAKRDFAEEFNSHVFRNATKSGVKERYSECEEVFVAIIDFKSLRKTLRIRS